MADLYGSGVMDPNAPRKEGAKDTESPFNPSPEEVELASQIEKLFQKASKARKKYDHVWVDNYKMFRGAQWLKKRPSYKNKEVINMVFQTIQSQTSIMSDVRPTVGFLPQDPSDLELSEILNEVYQYDFERNLWMDEVMAIILDGHIYGIGLSETCYSENLSGNRSGIKYACKDPFDFYPDPSATDVNKECEYVIDAKPEDLDKIKKKYAGHKYVTMIRSDVEDMFYSKRQVETLHRHRNTSLDMPAEKVLYGSEAEEDNKDKVLVITAYLKPSDTEQIEKEDKEGSEKIYITKLKYPRGRKVVKINNYIFEDTDLGYDDLEFHFERFVNYRLSREFFGMSEVDQLKGPQLTFNKILNFALDCFELMGNPIWLSPVEAKVNTRKLASIPGMIVEYANGTPPQRDEGAQINPQLFQMLQSLREWFDGIAGDQEVSRGINPTGVTANAAIENLLEAAQRRVKQKMRNLDSAMSQHGRHWLSLCFQYYTTPEIYRLTNKEGVSKYFKFHVEHRETGEVGPDGWPKKKKFAIIRDFVPDVAGNYVPAESDKQYEIRGEFDVRVSTISSLPFNKAETETRVLNLYDRGIIDEEEVLSRLEYPNRDQVLLRVRQKKAEEAEAAAGAKPQGA